VTPEVYRQRARQRILFYVVFGFMALIGLPMFVATMATGDGGTMLFMTVWVGILGFNGYMFLGSPREIELTESSIRFVGWRSRVVPWSQLRSVSSPWYDMNRFSWRWDWDGGRITTLGGFERQHRLLTSIEEHAPHVEIDV
jgi:hypothetical protein